MITSYSYKSQFIYTLAVIVFSIKILFVKKRNANLFYFSNFIQLTLSLFISLVSVSLLFISFSLAAKEEHLLPPDLLRIKQRGTLIIAMYHKDTKPFMFHDKNGLLIGHDVELAEKMAEALGVDVEFDRSAKTFNEIIDMVAMEKVDMAISLVSRNIDRARKVRFSRPYITLRPTLLINRMTASRLKIDRENPLRSLENFSGKIGEKTGTSYVGIAKRVFPKAEIIEYKEWENTTDAVRDLAVDMALRDEIGVKNYISEYPEQAIQLQMIMLDDARYADHLAIALPASSAHLQEWVNLYFEINGVTGNADNLLKQYREYYE